MVGEIICPSRLARPAGMEGLKESTGSFYLSQGSGCASLAPGSAPVCPASSVNGFPVAVDVVADVAEIQGVAPFTTPV